VVLTQRRQPIWYGLLGGFILAHYSVVETLQKVNFARVYAIYRGMFIVMSLIWAYKFDNYSPDKYDLIGAGIALLGVCIIYYAPKQWK